MAPARLRKAFLALACAPPLLLAAMTWRYHLDAPFYDAWVLEAMFERHAAGVLTLHDFWAQQNESRVYFPKLLLFGIGRLTHWNLSVEAGLQWCVALGILAAPLTALRRAECARGRLGTLWAAPAAALLVCSLSNWRTWMWGWSLHVSGAVCCTLWAAWLLALGAPRMRTLGLALVLALLATFSAVHGTAVWSVGALMILLRGGIARGQRLAALGLWLAMLGLAAAAYLNGYAMTPSPHSPLHVFVERPLAFLAYALAYLGAPIVSFWPPGAVLAGSAGLGMLGAYALTWRRFDAASRGAALACLGFVAAACGDAVLTAVKHAHEPLVQALSSRYIVWSTPFWLGLLGLTYLRFQGASDEAPAPRAVWGAVVALIVCVLASCAHGAYCADERHDAFCLGREALLTGEDEGRLIFLYPDPAVPKAARPFLKQHGLTIFRR